ncbi:ubiquitin carboxyl-terminal hydrolase CYLD-like isoform X2 [Montipora capricornis]|uniref:ubiquitin carboxyl-terminal hydrolase CYLD-like isoform X2 n=1 Tax=Montipora capricornis TaxID=246305 RepID=UPI0035F1F7E3
MERRNRYILLQDRVGEILGRNMLTLGLAPKSTRTQVLKGELLEALLETEQPGDSTRIALGGIDRKLRLECCTEDVTRLTREDADLLLAIGSVTLRYQIYIDKERLDFGKRLEFGSQVLVSVLTEKGISKNFPGVVRYKGDLPSIPGTMFGIQLHKNPGFGTSDGTFRNKRYFTCESDSGVFVGLDKLMAIDNAQYNSPSKTPKRDELGQGSVKSKLRDRVFPSFLKGKNDRSLQATTVDTLKIGQRVVTFAEDNDNPVRGTVHFIGEEKDASGQVLVGLELDERIGSGTGKWKGKQLFVCKRDYAAFVDIETAIPEKDFDNDPGEPTTRTTSQNQDKRHTDTIKQGKSQNEEMFARSLSYDLNKTSGVKDQVVIDVPHGYEVGTMVEVPMAGLPRYGVIKWIGYLPQMKDKLVVGLELEEEQAACSDGMFHGVRYFACPAGRGFFTLLNHCRQDSRFTPNSPASENSPSGKAFGSLSSAVVEGITEPPVSLEDKYCGNMRGLQGHHNSCYLDATLYSMFAFSWVFDALLHRQRKDTDLQEYDEVQRVLRESIVNPLRLHGFVRADCVLQLRELLDKLSSTAGLVNEEKDPEEFLNALLQQVLKADPFLRLKSRDVHKKESEGVYFYQIITDKDDSVKLAQVQQLLEQSFFSADIILAELPSCLILQMPRFGSRYKMYDMILPNLELEVSSIVESVPRECMLCGNAVARFECKRCSPMRMFGEDGNGIASYCFDCNSKVHSSCKRADHELRPLLVPRHFDTQNVPDKQKMELFAVVCIETSHYVSFVKCGSKPDSPWCFFDSMADRKEKNGYNIPAVTRCPEALEWLSKDPQEIVAVKERGEIPDKVQRLLGDGYLCMYQNLDMTMYK